MATATLNMISCKLGFQYSNCTENQYQMKYLRKNFHGGYWRTSTSSRRRRRNQLSACSVSARLFGPAIFEASKLRVMFLGVDEEKHPGNDLPRAYTITHSDVSAKLTLAISNTINRAQLQGWYNKLQRDEVVAEWKKMQDSMSLHVHCHISGGHFLLDWIANLRYYIFCKELPVVLKAVVHGDGNLFNKHPELEDALVWVYFHSNLKEFNRVECWGPLSEATEGKFHEKIEDKEVGEWPTIERPRKCSRPCNCCFPSHSVVTWPQDLHEQEMQQQQTY